MTPNLYLVLIFLTFLLIFFLGIKLSNQLDKTKKAMEAKPSNSPMFGYLPPRPEGKEWSVSDEKFKK